MAIGWLPTDFLVNIESLIVGDRITGRADLGCHNVPGGVFDYYMFSDELVVTKLIPPQIGHGVSARYAILYELVGPYAGTYTRPQAWIRARNYTATTAVRTLKKISDFPHKCTMCGQSAYVGLFEVSHRDESQSMDCLARRG